MSWFPSFRARVHIRWWCATVLSLVLIAACYYLMKAAIQPLFGYTYDTPYKTEIPIISALWYAQIWFGIAILLDRFIMSIYIHNSDTEVWQMEKIEISKRIAAYEAELARREKNLKE